MATDSTELSPLFQAAAVPPVCWTAADWQERLGHVPLNRILMVPPPGTARVADVERTRCETGRICELVDGTLVEKAVGFYESRVATVLGYFIERFLDDHNLGITAGEHGTLEILSDLVRAADVAFISWQRIPGGELTKAPVPDLVPDLAVEVLSVSNTRQEMERKLREYFEAGVRLVWYIEPRARTAKVYRAPEQFVLVGPDGILSGDDVLPGLELSLKELFARADRGSRKPDAE